MPEIEEFPGQPDALYPTMELLLELGKRIAPVGAQLGLRQYARELQASTSQKGWKPEAMMMRALMDGIHFGKWR
jgi:hypothetical protein